MVGGLGLMVGVGVGVGVGVRGPHQAGVVGEVEVGEVVGGDLELDPVAQVVRVEEAQDPVDRNGRVAPEHARGVVAHLRGRARGQSAPHLGGQTG